MGQPEKTYEKQLVALGRALQTLREEENVEVLIETALSYLEAEFEYKLIWIGLYDRLDHRLLGKGGRTPEGDIPLFKQRFLLTPGDILEQVVIQQRPVGLPDLREELRAGEWRKAAQQFDIQGTLIFPIRYKDRCFGVALLGSQLWGVSPKAEEKARLSVVLGGLAAALYQIETDWQRQQAKHPDQPLLTLLFKLQAIANLDQCLEAVVDETHKFVEPHRTNVYWYNPERRYFWRRASNRQRTAGFGDGDRAASGIMVSEVGSFYQALAADQIVSIGEYRSSLSADVTSRLMQQVRARSLLAAPILVQKELLGFLAVEGNDARIWQEQEKNYVRGAAQLVALAAPAANMEDTLAQAKLDRDLTAGLTRAICSDSDWKATLKTCGDLLLERLGASRFLILLHNRDRGDFDIAYQTQPASRSKKLANLPAPLPALNEVDARMLQESQEAIEIENWSEDLKLIDWRNAFLELGVRSLVACSTAVGHPLEGLLVVASDAARTWNARERELIYTVSQQIGLILHQWQLQSALDRQQQLLNALQVNFNALGQPNLSLEEYQRSALKQLAELYACSLAAAVVWLPGANAGRIVAPAAKDDRAFKLHAIAEVSVPVQADALVQWALAADGPLHVSASDLPPETRKWLKDPNISQILAVALRAAPDHQPTGVLLLAPQPDRRFSDEAVRAIALAASQIAWSRRYLLLRHTFQSQRQELERLNWYKHRRLEDFYRLVGSAVSRLGEMSGDAGEPPERLRGTLGSLQAMHLQQILRQLNSSVQSIRELLAREQWQLHLQSEIVPLAGLLRRSLDRLAPIIQQRQLWSQVRGENNLSIRADLVKIEWVVSELLFAACRRTGQGGRLDICCRSLDSAKVEISVVDSGTIPPALLADLQAGRPADLIAPSTLDRPPGLHLVICQHLAEQMGGELHFYHDEEGRAVSQLILPSVGAAL